MLIGYFINHIAQTFTFIIINNILTHERVSACCHFIFFKVCKIVRKQKCESSHWSFRTHSRTSQTSSRRAGLNSRLPRPPAPPLSSSLLNADVLLTSAFVSDKMFNIGSKLLLLFLLAFPCGLISIGESDFAFSFDGSRRAAAKEVIRQPDILTWHSHTAVHKQLKVFNSAFPTWLYGRVTRSLMRSNKKRVAAHLFCSEMNENGRLLPAAAAALWKNNPNH